MTYLFAVNMRNRPTRGTFTLRESALGLGPSISATVLDEFRMLKGVKETAAVPVVKQFDASYFLQDHHYQCGFTRILNFGHVAPQKRLRLNLAKVVKEIFQCACDPRSGLSQLRDDVFLLVITRAPDAADLGKRQA